MSTLDVWIQDAFKALRTSAWARYITLHPGQRAYLNAAILGGLGYLGGLIDPALSYGLFALAVLFWSMAVISDCVAFYKSVAESVLGKLLLVTIFAAGANIAIAISSQTVNELTGISPSAFPHTIAFVSLLISPALIALSMSLLFMLSMPFGIFYLMFHWLPDDASRVMLFPWFKQSTDIPYRKFTVLVQVISFAVVGVVAYDFQQGIDRGYNGLVSDLSASFLYNVEMLSKAPCSLGDAQRVAFLDGDRVLVGTRGEDRISFTVQSCVSGVGMR